MSRALGNAPLLFEITKGLRCVPRRFGSRGRRFVESALRPACGVSRCDGIRPDPCRQHRNPGQRIL